ncbi:MAG: response regulator [Verrucomicrobiota bacterium]
MKPIALIIEDDPSIRASIADRLESFGHDWEPAGSQNEAKDRIDRRAFTYILLDLELPIRFGRPPSIPTGKNILRDIRTSTRNKNTPVIVVTAHGHDRPDLAVELMRAGANHFVKKPFENLEQAIREVLGGPDGLGMPSAVAGPDVPELQKLGNATLRYFPDRIELDDLQICDPDNGTIWRILVLLKERKPNGQPKAYPGKRIADLLGLGRGQNAVCDAVSAFRRKSISLLAGNGIEATDDSFIMRGNSGYQLNPGLTVEDQSHQAPAKTKVESGETPADRQNWFLEELSKGRKLRRADLEKHFKISTATAKRDLSDLAGQIEFIGTGKAGYYVAATKDRR